MIAFVLNYTDEDGYEYIYEPPEEELREIVVNLVVEKCVIEPGAPENINVKNIVNNMIDGLEIDIAQLAEDYIDQLTEYFEQKAIRSHEKELMFTTPVLKAMSIGFGEIVCGVTIGDDVPL